MTAIVDGKEFPSLSFGIDVETPSGLNDADRVKYIEDQSKKVVDLIDPTLSKLDIDNVESQTVETESMSVSNNWEKNPNGENYKPRLNNGSEGPSIQQRVDRDIIPHFKDRLKRELAGKEPPLNARTH